MSEFTDKEFSTSLGHPIRLYEFKVGMPNSDSVRHWYYTNADHRVYCKGCEFDPIPICDDGIRQTGQTTADALTLTLQDDLPLVKLLASGVVTDEVWLTIRDTHWMLPDAWDTALIVWMGTVSSIKWDKPGEVEMVCASLSASMGRMGLRQTYQRNCPHNIYDTSCRLDYYGLRADATITAMDGASITLDDLPDHYYIGGFIVAQDPDGIMGHRGIERRDGLTLTLLGGTAGLYVEQQIVVFPGCNQTSEMCHSVYNNLLNFGGFRHMPGVSPLDAMLFY
jgi:uncharacterized phage protein (TIGR02218 family)